MKKVFVFGPDTGMEFGWFLMRWQAKMRYISQFYDAAYAITTPDRYFAVKDFAKPYEEMANDFRANMWRFDDCEVEYVHPSKQICCNEDSDKFIKFSYPTLAMPPCIAIHPRMKNDGREWSADKWNQFIRGLYNITDLKIVSIGKINATHHDIIVDVDEPVNKYSNPSVGVLGTAKLCIGASSGPIHLASLCGTPHLVWTDNKRWNLGGIKGTNRERYETYWNPLKTKVEVIDSHGWNPPVEIILEKAKEMLSA